MPEPRHQPPDHRPDMHRAMNNIAFRQCLKYSGSNPDRYEAAMRVMARHTLKFAKPRAGADTPAAGEKVDKNNVLHAQKHKHGAERDGGETVRDFGNVTG